MSRGVGIFFCLFRGFRRAGVFSSICGVRDVVGSGDVARLRRMKARTVMVDNMVKFVMFLIA